uniref:Uncharacterized protein LOC113799662 n=1 Tax=Dermatophagoides pteronyssinus TaxID=6956 RepID=A0A6P6YKR8_DERPT|nr:uncharacterized protein LOC113799662 [Dermatophagoides pteronyssinus]
MNRKLIFLLIVIVLNHFIKCENDRKIDDKQSANETIEKFRKQIIPEEIKAIKLGIRSKCREAMTKKFNQCSKRFTEEATDITLSNNDNNLIISGSEYARRWPVCCIIYRHQNCIKRAIESNSFYSANLCDETDVTIAESILEKHRTMNGFCPRREHIEYQMCDSETNSFFGHNTLTTIVLLLGAMTLSMAFLLTGYVVWNIQHQNRHRLIMNKFQLLEPLEFEMISTNQLN